jgi:hypothetical protein
VQNAIPFLAPFYGRLKSPKLGNPNIEAAQVAEVATLKGEADLAPGKVRAFGMRSRK